VTQTTTSRWRRYGIGAGLLAAGLLTGGILAGTISANADPTSDSATPSATVDESQPQRSDETLLTGSTADQVRAVALAEYPDATIQRVESDSEGVYEAHIITADGERVNVQVGEDFTVTGTQTGGPGRGHGPRGSHADSADDNTDTDGTGN